MGGLLISERESARVEQMLKAELTRKADQPKAWAKEGSADTSAIVRA